MLSILEGKGNIRRMVGNSFQVYQYIVVNCSGLCGARSAIQPLDVLILQAIGLRVYIFLLIVDLKGQFMVTAASNK